MSTSNRPSVSLKHAIILALEYMDISDIILLCAEHQIHNKNERMAIERLVKGIESDKHTERAKRSQAKSTIAQAKASFYLFIQDVKWLGLGKYCCYAALEDQIYLRFGQRHEIQTPLRNLRKTLTYCDDAFITLFRIMCFVQFRKPCLCSSSSPAKQTKDSGLHQSEVILTDSEEDWSGDEDQTSDDDDDDDDDTLLKLSEEARKRTIASPPMQETQDDSYNDTLPPPPPPPARYKGHQTSKTKTSLAGIGADSANGMQMTVYRSNYLRGHKETRVARPRIRRAGLSDRRAGRALNRSRFHMPTASTYDKFGRSRNSNLDGNGDNLTTSRSIMLEEFLDRSNINQLGPEEDMNTTTSSDTLNADGIQDEVEEASEIPGGYSLGMDDQPNADESCGSMSSEKTLVNDDVPISKYLGITTKQALPKKLVSKRRVDKKRKKKGRWKRLVHYGRKASASFRSRK